MIRLILSIIVAIIVWATYHKIFSVAYFGLGAFVAEIWVCFIIGYSLVNYLFWWKIKFIRR